MYSDTNCVQYKSSDGSETKTHCYTDFDNYIYRDVGDSIANEFLISNQEAKKDTLSWSFSRFALEEEKDSSSLMDINMYLIKTYEGVGSWISLPIFNKNYDLMVVEFVTVCGALCGYGVTFLLEFKDGDWIIKRKITEWVS
jgi:hypothetical protein